jgi:hypothetical protein
VLNGVSDACLGLSIRGGWSEIQKEMVGKLQTPSFLRPLHLLSVASVPMGLLSASRDKWW